MINNCKKFGVCSIHAIYVCQVQCIFYLQCSANYLLRVRNLFVLFYIAVMFCGVYFLPW